MGAKTEGSGFWHCILAIGVQSLLMIDSGILICTQHLIVLVNLIKPAKRLIFTKTKDITRLWIEHFRRLWLDPPGLNYLAENRLCTQGVIRKLSDATNHPTGRLDWICNSFDKAVVSTYCRRTHEVRLRLTTNAYLVCLEFIKKPPPLEQLNFTRGNVLSSIEYSIIDKSLVVL